MTLSKMPNSETTGLTVAESLGHSAFSEGMGIDRNPFSWLRDGDKRSEWSRGWFAARDSSVRELSKRAEMART